MTDLLIYLFATAFGYFLGAKLRDKKEKLAWTGRVQTVALMILIVLMGMRMGSNEEVTNNLGTIGVSALFMTVVVLAFCVLGLYIARRLMRFDKCGRLQNKNSAGNDESSNSVCENVAKENENNGGGGSTPLKIIVAVALGMAFGFFVIRRVFADNIGVFDELCGIGIMFGLSLLLVFIGLDLGLDGTLVENFRKVGLRIFVIPLVVVISTLLGALVCSFFLALSAKECMAIGAGFGWYTLAPGIIIENGFVTAGAVAFLHNVMRELFSIIFVPLVARKVGYIECVGMPGAAAMDVCLPIVERSTRSEIAVYSFVSGAILSALVSVLVPLIIG